MRQIRFKDGKIYEITEKEYKSVFDSFSRGESIEIRRIGLFISPFSAIDRIEFIDFQMEYGAPLRWVYKQGGVYVIDVTRFFIEPGTKKIVSFCPDSDDNRVFYRSEYEDGESNINFKDLVCEGAWLDNWEVENKEKLFNDLRQQCQSKLLIPVGLLVPSVEKQDEIQQNDKKPNKKTAKK